MRQQTAVEKILPEIKMAKGREKIMANEELSQRQRTRAYENLSP
jgi:hypothetical protein